MPTFSRRRDSFYYSVTPERLEKVKDAVKKWFDVQYCVNKAMSVLNAKEDSIELLEWAQHLATLAGIMKPDSNGVRLVEARVLLRRGERETGLKILEDIHDDKPKGSGDEEDAVVHRDQDSRPAVSRRVRQARELALHCYVKFKDYHKSGADTLYQIARCYEAMGDIPARDPVLQRRDRLRGPPPVLGREGVAEAVGEGMRGQ